MVVLRADRMLLDAGGLDVVGGELFLGIAEEHLLRQHPGAEDLGHLRHAEQAPLQQVGELVELAIGVLVAAATR